MRSRGTAFWGAWIGVAIAVVAMWPLVRDLFKMNALVPSLHIGALLFSIGIFTLQIWRRPSLSGIRLYWPLIVGLLLHAVIVILFQPHIVAALQGGSSHQRGRNLMPFFSFIAIFYLPLFLVGKRLILMWVQSARQSRVDRIGVPATAVIKRAVDLGARMKKGVRKFYLVELTLVIKGLPQSPYEVTDNFLVSEYHIHRLTSSSATVPVKVDPENSEFISLDLSALDE